MTKRQRRFDDADFDFGDRRSAGVGTIFLATALGVGIGLLAAPAGGSGSVSRRWAVISARGSRRCRA
jgi:hypothetical protein